MNYHDWGMIYFRGIGTTCGKKNINALEVQQDADEFSYKIVYILDILIRCYNLSTKTSNLSIMFVLFYIMPYLCITKKEKRLSIPFVLLRKQEEIDIR